MDNSVDFKGVNEGNIKFSPGISKASFQFEQVATKYQGIGSEKNAMERARMDIENKTKREDVLKGINKISKGIARVKFEENDEVYKVDIGHGLECKNEREAAVNLAWIEVKVYAEGERSKAGKVSVAF